MIPGERREPAARSRRTSIPGALGRTISSAAAAPAAMRRKLFSGGARIVFGLLVFSILVTAILLRPPKWLSDFDQSFYLTIAYDLAHHGVFSNGMFDAVDSTVATPPPGTFFAPLYPWLIVGAAKIDDRFAAAVDCSVEANHKVRDGAECEVYARPMHLLHAAFLALGVLAIALAAELIFSSSAVFWLAGILATLALLPDADLFSFVMTESISFSLYSIAALALVLALKAPRIRNVVLAGGLFGLLCLTRASFVVLAPLGVGLIVVNGRWLSPAPWRSIFEPGARVRARMAVGRRAVDRSQRRLGRKVGADGGIRLRHADRAFRFRRHERAGIPAGIPVLPAGDRRARGRPGVRPRGHGKVRLLHAEQLFPRRPFASRQAGRGSRPARSADQ